MVFTVEDEQDKIPKEGTAWGADSFLRLSHEFSARTGNKRKVCVEKKVQQQGHKLISETDTSSCLGIPKHVSNPHKFVKDEYR
jgi:hypothetical protein